jgi:hypothetical protein
MYFKITDVTLKSVANGGHVVNGTYYDLRLETTGGTQLKHEILRYSATTGTVEGWMLIPTLTYASNYTFYLYYGKTSAPNEQQVSLVYPNWTRVIHMADGMASSKGASYGDGDVGAGASRSNDSPVGSGYLFNNSSTGYINLGNYSRWTTRPQSWSFWVKTAGTNYKHIFATGRSASFYSGVSLRVWTTNTINTQTGDNTGGGSPNRNNFGTTNTFANGTWRKIDVCFNAHNDVKIYVNGVLQSGSYSGTATTIAYAATEYTRIGQSHALADQYMDGNIAELRCVSGALPKTAGGMVTEYNNQFDYTSFFSVGAEDPAPSVAPVDLAQSQSLDAVVLTQKHSIVVGELAHTHLLDATVLTQKQLLSADELLHSHALDAVSVTQKHLITVSELLHSNLLDGNLNLVQHVLLSVEDLLSAHTLDETTLSVPGILAVYNLSHNHTLDEVMLTQKHSLFIDDSLQAHDLGGDATLTQKHNIIVNDMLHAQNLDSLFFSQKHLLVVLDASQGHIVDEPTLEQKYILELQDASQAQSLDSSNVLTQLLLEVQDVVQFQYLDGTIIYIKRKITPRNVIIGNNNPRITMVDMRPRLIIDSNSSGVSRVKPENNNGPADTGKKQKPRLRDFPS